MCLVPREFKLALPICWRWTNWLNLWPTLGGPVEGSWEIKTVSISDSPKVIYSLPTHHHMLPISKHEAANKPVYQQSLEEKPWHDAQRPHAGLYIVKHSVECTCTVSLYRGRSQSLIGAPYAQNWHYMALCSKWTLYGSMVKVEMIWPYAQNGYYMAIC